MFSIYIDPDRIDPEQFFEKEIASYVAFFKDTKTIAEVETVELPGEPEAAMRQDRMIRGVPLMDETWKAIVDTGLSVGIGEESVARALVR